MMHLPLNMFFLHFKVTCHSLSHTEVLLRLIREQCRKGETIQGNTISGDRLPSRERDLIKIVA